MGNIIENDEVGIKLTKEDLFVFEKEK
jgi:hypothetical protein